jgi:hypothetical protein
MSDEPPGVKGTTNLIDFSGKLWACATGIATKHRKKSHPNLMSISSSLQSEER